MHASSKFVSNTRKEHCHESGNGWTENRESCNSIHRLVTLLADFVVENTHKSRVNSRIVKRQLLEKNASVLTFVEIHGITSSYRFSFPQFGNSIEYLVYQTFISRYTTNSTRELFFPTLSHRYFPPNFTLSLFQQVGKSKVEEISSTIFRTKEQPLRLKKEKKKKREASLRQPCRLK